MKIETVGADKLRLTISQWLLHCFGLLILTGSVLVVFYLMKEYTIVCNKKLYNHANQCTLESDIFNVYHTSTNLGELQQAVVVSGRSSKGGTIYYVVLKTSNGLINLTGGSSSGRSDKDAAADAINSYISKSLDKGYKVPYPTAWWIYALVAIFPLIGIVLLSVKGAIIVFDGTAQTVVIRRKGIFGSNENTFLFTEIEKVIIQEFRNARGYVTYRLALALKDKSPMPLVSSYDASSTKIERIAKQLNEFLDRYRTS